LTKRQSVEGTASTVADGRGIEGNTRSLDKLEMRNTLQALSNGESPTYKLRFSEGRPELLTSCPPDADASVPSFQYY